MQLEIFRQAAQDLLARLAPDLAAQLLSIFRAHSKQPASAGPQSANIPTAASQPDSTVPHGHHTAPEDVVINSAAAVTSPKLGAGGCSASGVASAAQASQSAPSQSDAIHPKSSTVNFAETITLPLLQAGAVSDMSQSMRSAGSFSSAHIPTDRPSRLSLLPTALPLEDGMPSAVPAVGQENPRSIASVRAQAWQIQQQMEQDAKHAHLVVLQPQEIVQFSSHVLVMKGSVKLDGSPVSTQLVPGEHALPSIQWQFYLVAQPHMPQLIPVIVCTTCCWRAWGSI